MDRVISGFNTFVRSVVLFSPHDISKTYAAKIIKRRHGPPWVL